MDISRQLIEKFITGQCTPEEQELVSAWFREYPEKFSEYYTESSWEAFQVDESIPVPGERLWSSIQQQVSQGRARRLRTIWSVAAAIMIIITGYAVYQLSRPETTGEGTIARKAPAQKTLPPHAITPMPQTRKTIANTSDDFASSTLPDGSVVKIGPQSSITFDSLFRNNTRDIFLSGEATFTVVKDKTRPFIVHSKNFTTTALGTVFTVNDRNPSYVIIRLHSGKIVIRKEKDFAPSFNEVYLSAGQQLKVNRTSLTANVTTIAATRRPPLATPRIKPAILSFNKQSLPEVLAKLQQEYHVELQYDAAALANMEFTGVYDPSKMTLQAFLETLCLLNELNLIENNSNNFTLQIK
ncbi:FecR domain-containing protein [Flavihumibacter petaseus]|uniref:Putative anti-sigma factor n=1 Tax=Flavihumibacter petaseus NBRC 106054 TaxID=1220578 RepID=A0A0E9N305_9BACT|nr:FecR domain-containing protein [Flavihumibacter petaseus]GAO44046.1 putative anti-sigma factor [Flavihumibacter petaseus NBRC 106054]